jgi:hypothetical protein
VVTAVIEHGVLRLELSPSHKILALKGSLEIPLESLESVEMGREIARAGPEGSASRVRASRI